MVIVTGAVLGTAHKTVLRLIIAKSAGNKRGFLQENKILFENFPFGARNCPESANKVIEQKIKW